MLRACVILFWVLLKHSRCQRYVPNQKSTPMTLVSSSQITAQDLGIPLDISRARTSKGKAFQHAISSLLFQVKLSPLAIRRRKT